MANGRPVGPADRPAVMGIVNLTPDSFSDGGRFSSHASAIEHAERLVYEGADLLDVGGESSRPGAQPISVDEELDRVLPVVQALAARLAVPLSVDTTKPEVAQAVIEAGAAIINDIQGLADPRMRQVVAASEVGVVVMHIQGSPGTMQDAPEYADVFRDVSDHLASRIMLAEEAGIARDRIAIDPGIGFGKTFDHNLTLLRRLREFDALGCPLLIGTSRKGFLGKITGRSIEGRGTASVASALAAGSLGASVVRVHDVAETVDAFRVWDAQVGWKGSR